MYCVPDVRPVNIGGVDRRAIIGYLVRGLEDAAEAFLTGFSRGQGPGISILFHASMGCVSSSSSVVISSLYVQVYVRIDLRTSNAYNESSRAEALRRMAEVPGLSSLRVVPLMHAMYGPAGIVVLPDGSRLFDK